MLGGFAGGAGGKRDADILAAMFSNQNKTSQPIVLGNTILPGERAMNMMVQNWFGENEPQQNGNPLLKRV